MGIVSAIFLVLITILLPPVGTYIVAGCGADQHLLDIAWVRLYFPGHIHAFYLKYVYYERKEQAREGRFTAARAPGVYSERVQSGGHGYDQLSCCGNLIHANIVFSITSTLNPSRPINAFHPISDDAIELSSQHDLHFGGQTRTTNSVWRGDDNSKLSDSESERAVVGEEQHNAMKKEDIVGTINVKVEEHVTGRAAGVMEVAVPKDLSTFDTSTSRSSEAKLRTRATMINYVYDSWWQNRSRAI
ncbi:hypothetical protein DL98DRAFT_583476 [Cadophora sp. DSE1049]|nr:hypothetical protein DL98DRAFT_583476 [Cadophora sp. DSE1049]